MPTMNDSTPNSLRIPPQNIDAERALLGSIMLRPGALKDVLETVVRQNAYAYQTLLNSLTLAQQRVLRLAANEKQALFQKDLLVKYEVSSGAALHSSINALKSKGILDEEGTKRGRVLFDDPLFAYWLRMCFIP